MREVIAVETLPALPGLLSRGGWDALAAADTVFTRAPENHPASVYMAASGIELHAAPEGSPDPADRDLTSGIAPIDRRRARALYNAAESGPVTYLLAPDDDPFVRALGTEAAAQHASLEVVMTHPRPAGLALLRAAEVVASLRDPQTGCPWDLKQDHQTLAKYAIEESYELVDAIADGDDAHVAEELGDVLLQVLLHAQVASDRRAFSIDAVANGLSDKLVRRHPHVFADARADTAEDVEANWAAIKADEKGGADAGHLAGLPRELPALQLAQKFAQRAELQPQESRVLEGVTAAIESGGEDELARVVVDIAALAQMRGMDIEGAVRRAVRAQASESV